MGMGIKTSWEVRAQRPVFWDACIETSGSWSRPGVSTLCLVPFFYSVFQRQAEEPCMHCSRALALNAFPIQEFLVGSGIGIWAALVPLVACPSRGPSFHILPGAVCTLSSLLTLLPC